MVDIDKAEDAYLEEIRNKIAGLKTVDTYEGEYDSRTIHQMLVAAPFCLIHYDGLTPVEGERLHTGQTGINQTRFIFYIGSKSLRSRREGQLGCYSIIKKCRELFDGVTLTIDGEEITPSLTDEHFVESVNGLNVYSVEYSIYQI